MSAIMAPSVLTQEAMVEDDDKKLVRSPQFPFIPLQKAIERTREFEVHYGPNAGRVANAVKTWKYGEKSSGGIQTIAALSAYGLMSDEGSLDARKLKVTPLALTILKDKRPGAAEEAIRKAALNPKIIAKLWADWGASRPPDAECISTLHLDMKFTEEAAGRLLRIYDATIGYAKLVDEDKSEDNAPDGDGAFDPDAFDEPPPRKSKKASATPEPEKVQLMANERVIFSHEVRPEQSFRVVAVGAVDEAMVRAISAFVKFQKELLGFEDKPGSAAGVSKDKQAG